MLEVRSLGKRYGDGTVALADFSLSQGEGVLGVLGLLGPNGAGKTTLLSILATITRPTSGGFSWEGVDGVRDPMAVRRVLGFLPQDFGVYVHVRFVGDGSALSGARAVEPSLEDAYLLTLAAAA